MVVIGVYLLGPILVIIPLMRILCNRVRPIFFHPNPSSAEINSLEVVTRHYFRTIDVILGTCVSAILAAYAIFLVPILLVFIHAFKIWATTNEEPAPVEH